MCSKETSVSPSHQEKACVVWPSAVWPSRMMPHSLLHWVSPTLRTSPPWDHLLHMEVSKTSCLSPLLRPSAPQGRWHEGVAWYPHEEPAV